MDIDDSITCSPTASLLEEQKSHTIFCNFLGNTLKEYRDGISLLTKHNDW